MKKTIAFIIFFLLVSSSSYSATYYVENKGSAILNNTDEGATAWSNATNILTPTSGATAMAHSGAIEPDHVYFRGGLTKDSVIYELGEMLGFGTDQEEYQNIWQPSYSGVSGNPIIFEVYPGEHVTLNGNANLTNEYASKLAYFANLLGVYRQNYITIDGFKYTCDGGTNMAGSAVTYHQEYTNLLGIVLKNLEMDGGSTPNGDGWYNIGAIRAEDVDGLLVQNCVIYGYNGIETIAIPHNTSAYKAYHTLNVIVENCDISDSTVAIFDKSSGRFNTYRNNFIYDVSEGIEHTETDPGDDDENDNISVYNNIIHARIYGILVNQTGPPSDNWQIYNNTIVKDVATLYTGNVDSAIKFLNLQGEGHDFYNNIFSFYPGSDGGHFNAYGNNPSMLIDTFDHNLFFNPQASGMYIRYHLSPSFWETILTLGAWQSSGLLDGGGNPGTGSINAEPIFVGPLTTPAGYELASGSPGENGDRLGTANMGADVTNVGSGAAPPTNPVVTCQSSDSTTNTTYPITATYTLEGARTVASCTWSNSLGGSGTLTATGGSITGTVTGLSVGVNTITITLTDSAAEAGSCAVPITRTPPATSTGIIGGATVNANFR